MPRWEVIDYDRNIHPIQILVFVLGFFFFGWSLSLFLNAPSSLGSIFSIIASTTFLIYVTGRIYSTLTIKNDFIEITREKLSFRSTPAFGQGWLPRSKELNFDEIKQVDIIEVIPFQDAENSTMAINLKLENYKNIIIGNNLSEEQIIKIGLALKGTVALSNSLQRLLGREDVGDQIKDIVDMGKSLWNSFKKKTGEDN